MRMNPRPLMSEEKLDTQNGIKNKRNVCQRSAAPLTLSRSAMPMMKLIPSEFSQIEGVESK